MPGRSKQNSVIGKLRHWYSGRRHTDTSQAQRWIVLDVETSGLDSSRDHLLSIGAVAMIGREIIIDDSFEALIQRSTASSHENIVIHGISGSAQRNGQTESEVLLDFERWRNGAPCIGWHVGFDVGFLSQAYARIKIKDPCRESLDLAPLAQVLFNERSSNLDDYLNKLGIQIQSRHSAPSDAWMTALLAVQLTDIAFKQGAHDFRSLRALAGNARWAGV